MTEKHNLGMIKNRFMLIDKDGDSWMQWADRPSDREIAQVLKDNCEPTWGPFVLIECVRRAVWDWDIEAYNEGPYEVSVDGPPVTEIRSGPRKVIIR